MNERKSLQPLIANRDTVVQNACNGAPGPELDSLQTFNSLSWQKSRNAAARPDTKAKWKDFRELQVGTHPSDRHPIRDKKMFSDTKMAAVPSSDTRLLTCRHVFPPDQTGTRGLSELARVSF